MADFHGLNEIGILAHSKLNERDHGALFLSVAERLCEDHNISGITAPLHAAKRNAVRDAAVQKLSPVYFNYS